MLLLQGTTPDPVPFSAYALCYFPLAAIVLGIIAAFFMTDWHSRRPYLRFNPFIAANLSKEQIDARPAQTGETPAGPLGPTGEGNTTVFMGRGPGDVAPAVSGNVEPDVTSGPAVAPASMGGAGAGTGRPVTSQTPPPVMPVRPPESGKPSSGGSGLPSTLTSGREVPPSAGQRPAGGDADQSSKPPSPPNDTNKPE